MSTFAWPPTVLPSKVTWQYSSTSKLVPSPFDGTTTILTRPGDRWMASADFSPLFGTPRADLISFLARLRQQYHNFLLPAHFYQRRGSWNFPNVIPNGGTFDVVAPWTAGNGVLSIDSGMLRITNSGATNGSARSGALPVVPGTPYMLRVECLPGSTDGSASAYAVYVGTSPGNSDLSNSGSITADGVYTTIFVASGSSVHVTLFCNTTLNHDFVFYDNAIMEPCIETSGIQPLTDRILLQGLPANVAGVLLKSDMLEVNQELKMVMHGLNSEADGTGSVRISPPLRQQVGSGAAVILGSPRGRFYLTEDALKWDTEGFFESSFSLNFTEDVGSTS